MTNEKKIKFKMLAGPTVLEQNVHVNKNKNEIFDLNRYLPLGEIEKDTQIELNEKFKE